jgi:hypothetical protein
MRAQKLTIPAVPAVMVTLEIRVTRTLPVFLSTCCMVILHQVYLAMAIPIAVPGNSVTEPEGFVAYK